jgi:hypothetical protein
MGIGVVIGDVMVTPMPSEVVRVCVEVLPDVVVVLVTLFVDVVVTVSVVVPSDAVLMVIVVVPAEVVNVWVLELPGGGIAMLMVPAEVEMLTDAPDDLKLVVEVVVGVLFEPGIVCELEGGGGTDPE